MALTQRGFRHDSDVLIRQIDGRLATLRVATDQAGLVLAERIADVLRRLVVDTTKASAADRARVRAAVHFFVVRRDGRNARRPARSVSEDVRVVNEIVRDLGREDLAIAPATG
ncbi:MAG TPA: hypothetical protein VFE14_02555 [Micromonosporaceae bacterium]|jgi:hypothetical protein|nr:hypothetical protein [Micromonosporaceae bacterium]